MVEAGKKPCKARKTVQCPNCGCQVLSGNFVRHQQTKKCKQKNKYKTRAEIGKERVQCFRCKRVVCKNKFQRHFRSKRCERSVCVFSKNEAPSWESVAPCRLGRLQIYMCTQSHEQTDLGLSSLSPLRTCASGRTGTPFHGTLMFLETWNFCHLGANQET